MLFRPHNKCVVFCTCCFPLLVTFESAFLPRIPRHIFSSFFSAKFIIFCSFLCILSLSISPVFYVWASSTVKIDQSVWWTFQHPFDSLDFSYDIFLSPEMVSWVDNGMCCMRWPVVWEVKCNSFLFSSFDEWTQKRRTRTNSFTPVPFWLMFIVETCEFTSISRSTSRKTCGYVRACATQSHSYVFVLL